MDEEVKEVSKKKLSPEATLLLTIGGVALAIVVYGLIRFIIAGIQIVN